MLPGAILFLLPVVVVDVSGDRLDPAHTRQLVEHELNVTAVSSDDPRAANASGRIEVSGNATDKKLTVKYRKLDEPVERSIDLADDASRAESDAAFLAGNLARDEASELTPPPPKAKPTMPQLTKAGESASSFLWSEDDRSLALMRAFLTQSRNDEKASRVRTGVVEMAVAGALIAPAVYATVRGADDPEAKVFIAGATTVGASLLVSGFLQIVIDQNEFEPLEKKLREHEKNASGSKEALEDMEKEWARLAEDRRSTRKTVGWISVGLSAAFLAIGTASLMGTDSPVSSFGATFLALGGIWAVNGASFFAGESATERSYRMWRTVSTTPKSETNVSFGATVLPGGGGAASFALTF